MATKAKASLINAFLKLTEEYEFDKVTVTSLVESCGISRQTFYYHFDDIDKMISWAFEYETEQICNTLNYSTLDEAAKKYSSFFKRYDMMLKKASTSSDFIKIHKLIYNSFMCFISEYISKKRSPAAPQSEETEFFISYCASAFTGLVVLEIQKKQFGYDELMKKLVKSLKTIA